MSLYNIREINIYINMFVHYPEIYNANTISNNFSSYLKNKSLFNEAYNQDCNVMINSAPHIVDESLEIKIIFGEDDVILVDKDAIILNLKKFIIEYFNNQVKDISIEFIRKNKFLNI